MKGTSAATPHERQTTPHPGVWTSLAVFAGGAGVLDAALERAVAPSVRELPDTTWFFERYVGTHGPHLRLHLRDLDRQDLERLEHGIGQRLRELELHPAPEPLLPRPRSHRRTDGRVGLEPAEGAHEPTRWPEAAVSFAQASSEVVLDLLPRLRSGRERAAWGLLLADTLGELGGGRERSQFWRGVAREWLGDDERGRRVHHRLSEEARALGPELLSQATELREREPAPATLTAYSNACHALLGDAPDHEAVARHCHLTSNRLGLSPLEEALLALVLAREGGPGAHGRDEVVRLREVTKESDGGRAALSEVSLEVAQGEIFGVLGPQGAGKTTLLGVAAGLRVPTFGGVRTLGLDPLEDRPELAGDIGIPLPDDELAAQSTCRENLELRAHVSGRDATPDDVLADVGLTNRAGVKVAEIDRGERRLLSIATALLSDPRLLLLDTPTAGLSPTEREALWNVVKAQRDLGRTVLVATSSLQEAVSLCDRAALVLGGRVLDTGDPETLAERHFEERCVRFDTEAKPDRAMLEDLPETRFVKVAEQPGHWTTEVRTLQPDELMKLIGNDPAFPRVVELRREYVEDAFPDAPWTKGGDF